MGSWPEGRAYLEQQRRRLPTHKYRRLHLNLPGAPDGAFFDVGNDHGVHRARSAAAAARGAPTMSPSSTCRGGTSDDAVLAIAHKQDGVVVLDLVDKQAGRPPFNPRLAVAKFAALLRSTACRGGRRRLRRADVPAGLPRARDRLPGLDLPESGLYEALEPRLNAREVELLDIAELAEQLAGLVRRGAKVGHAAGAHDDWANACAGAAWLAAAKPRVTITAEHFLIGEPLQATNLWPTIDWRDAFLN